MIQVQSSIRAEVSRGSFPAPVGTEVFRAYAIAYDKGLIPEMENAARLTLDHPMSFETLGEVLRCCFFWRVGIARLSRLRKRRRDELVTCLESFLEGDPPAFGLVVPIVGSQGFPTHGSPAGYIKSPHGILVTWNERCSRIDLQHLHAYFMAIQTRAGCHFFSRVYMTNGPTFCAELENKVVQARNKVHMFVSVPKCSTIHLTIATRWSWLTLWLN
jgi:hypothetical protein